MIVLIPDHCLSIYFPLNTDEIPVSQPFNICKVPTMSPKGECLRANVYVLMSEHHLSD